MADHPTRDRLAAALTTHLAPPLLELDLDLEGVEVTPAGRRRVLKVAVDRDGGVSMDDVAEATRTISTVLDETDVMGEQPYTLEVSSPGVDRPLTQPRHWRRNQGRLVRTALRDGRTLTGRVVEHDQLTVTLDLDGRSEQLPLTEIATARVQVEFNRPGGADQSGPPAPKEA